CFRVRNWSAAFAFKQAARPTERRGGGLRASPGRSLTARRAIPDLPRPLCPDTEFVMAEKNLKELFRDTVKALYFAEKNILSALTKMAKAAQSAELKAAFEKHERETEEHVARLEKVFAELDENPRGKMCEAIMGIIEEGQEVMKEFKGKPALDAGLLAAA